MTNKKQIIKCGRISDKRQFIHSCWLLFVIIKGCGRLPCNNGECDQHGDFNLYTCICDAGFAGNNSLDCDTGKFAWCELCHISEGLQS